MLPYDPNYEPQGSFQQALPVPTDDPDVGTIYSVCFNAEYLPYVLGSLYQGLESTTWDTSDLAALQLAQDRANQLIYLFEIGCDDMPTGAVVWFGSDLPPSGWLVCDGSAQLRSQFPFLFGVIGISFGPGDGSTTFNLPDLIGRTPIGTGMRGGGTNFVLAATGGEEAHTLTTAEMPSHHHDYSGTLTLLTGTPPPLDASAPNPFTSATSDTGGGSAHNTIQPYQVLTPIIKT